MGLQKEENPNRPLGRLLKELPEGVAVPSAWLAERGISPQLVRKYVASGWLVPLARGVYARPVPPVDWQGVVLALQRLARRPFHVGGLSALNVQGLAHYLPLAARVKSRVLEFDYSTRERNPQENRNPCEYILDCSDGLVAA